MSLCTSLGLAIFAPDLGSAAASLCTTTAVYYSLDSCLVDNVWIALDSAISAWICISLYCLYLSTCVGVTRSA